VYVTSVSRRVCVAACAVLCTLFPVMSAAQTPPDALPAAQDPTPQQIREELDRLKREFESVRDSYGARLTALEAKLAQIQGAAAPAAAGAEQPVAPVPAQPTPAQPTPAQPTPAQPPTAAAPGEVAVPQGAGGAGGPQGNLPVYGNAAASSKIFNPDIAVIGNFLGAIGENKVASIPAFEMNEAEATFQAVVDPYARADFFVTFHPEGVDLEEGFLTLTSLPGGLLAKVGKMKAQFGKVNTMHPHSLPWADLPLAMTNLLGGEDGLDDSGISVSRLVLNPWFFLEATGELFQGNGGPFQSHERSDVSWLGRVRGYRDLGESMNLDIGTSVAGGHNDAGPNDTTRLIGVDATFRYRPLQRAIYRRFLARTELFWSRREQPLDVGGTQSGFGYYVSGDYQFARRWFAGVRYDHSDRATDASLNDHGPSLLLTFWPSEFSQVRGQYRRTTYAEGSTANELLFQFLFSIGAHGAHVF
jgi:hypothetical protein